MSGEDKQEVCLRAVTIITDLRDFDKEEKGMWPYGMTRQEMEAFLRKYSYELIEILLDAYDMTVDEIVNKFMADDAEAFTAETNYWEVC